MQVGDHITRGAQITRTRNGQVAWQGSSACSPD